MSSSGRNVPPLRQVAPGRSLRTRRAASPVAAILSGMRLPEVLLRAQEKALALPDAYDASYLDAVNAGEALAERIEAHAQYQGLPLNAWDSWVLRHDVPELLEASEARGENEEQVRAAIAGMNNRVVDVVRHAIVFDKGFEDTRTIQATPHLRVPVFWELNYEVVYATDLPWMVSMVMQNVFLGNPLAGERRPWTSP